MPPRFRPGPPPPPLLLLLISLYLSYLFLLHPSLPPSSTSPPPHLVISQIFQLIDQAQLINITEFVEDFSCRHLCKTKILSLLCLTQRIKSFLDLLFQLFWRRFLQQIREYFTFLYFSDDIFLFYKFRCKSSLLSNFLSQIFPFWLFFRVSSWKLTSFSWILILFKSVLLKRRRVTQVLIINRLTVKCTAQWEWSRGLQILYSIEWCKRRNIARAAIFFSNKSLSDSRTLCYFQTECRLALSLYAIFTGRILCKPAFCPNNWIPLHTYLLSFCTIPFTYSSPSPFLLLIFCLVFFTFLA